MKSIREKMMKRREFMIKSATALAGTLLLPGRKRPKLRARALRRGDRIGIVAPAGIVYEPEQFKTMESVLGSMGLDVVFGKYVRNRYGYFSGTDRERADDLNRFFADPEIDAILTARGGWGSNRILPLVDFEQIERTPKFFCGFSDITSLHLAIYRKTGLVTFHGPNGTSEWTPCTRESFYRTAFGLERNPLLRICRRPDDPFLTIVPGKARGPLLGGNLTLVTSLIGTPYLPDMSGAILFLEDIGEQIYRIDRMFSRLMLSGLLERVDGVAFGRCTDCRRGAMPGPELQEILRHYLVPLGKPAFYGADIGHEPDNLTLPCGVESELDATQGTIQILESPLL